jgi:hypothetical protein
MLMTKQLIPASDVVRMNQWADEVIARIKPQLTSLPAHESS